MENEIVEPEVIQEEPQDQGGEPGEQEERQPSPDVEQRAKRMGHVSKEEFRGDPSKWIDAETFVKRAEEQLPLAQANLRKLDRQLAEQDQRIAEMTQSVKEITEFHKRAEERQRLVHEKELRELKVQMRQAVSDGDTERFDAVQQEIEDLQKVKPPEPSPAAPTGTDSQQQGRAPSNVDLSQRFGEWAARNPWYGPNQYMTEVANAASGIVMTRAKHENWDHERIFQEYDKEIRRQMPDKFENPKRKETSSVSHGSDSVPSGGPTHSVNGKKTFNHLPQEAKAQCLKWEKEGLLTKEQYLADYPWEQAERR